MSNPNEKQPIAAPVGPWREGRPSFKAFRPEIFILTILTILCFAFAIKWSCSTADRPAEDAPKAVSVDAPLPGFAFAQDASIDELATPEEESDALETADAETTEVAETQELPASAESTSTSTSETAVATSVPAVDASAQGSKKNGAKFLWIWIVCMIGPAVLWIWRGWIWICEIYGTKFKIVCDPDNPKATTILIIRGVFNKKTDSLHIAQIKDIRSSQTLWQKYAQGGVGTISLTTSDVSDPVVDMKNMDEPSRVFNAFDELRRHYWGRGGMQLNSGSADAAELGDGASGDF